MHDPPATPPYSSHTAADVTAEIEAQNLDSVVHVIEPDHTFTLNEFEDLKAKVVEGRERRAPGVDGIERALVLNIYDDALLELSNLCIEVKSIPSV